jgi:D-alanyl-D-alanine carboxypeptidase
VIPAESKKIFQAMNEIDRLLMKQVEKNTPSVQYLVFDKDRDIYRFHAGFADIKNQKKAAGNTTYHAYSVTKTFTALAVLQLAQQKKLDIDHEVNKYMPGFPYHSAITIRQLLTHSAGIPNPLPLSWIHPANEDSWFDRNVFFSQIFNRYNRVKSKPNEKFAYSNLGYVLLGELIEKISGVQYETYVRENISGPVGIPPAELDFIITDPDQHAKGYHPRFSFSNAVLGLLIDKTKYLNRTEGKWKLFSDFYINGASYGGLIGNVNAFSRYIRELLKPDCKLINEEFKTALFSENRTNTGKPTGMCMSWFKGQLNGEDYFTHAGGGGGYYCEIRIYPNRDMGSVIMFNRTGMTDERFLDKVDKYFLKTSDQTLL